MGKEEGNVFVPFLRFIARAKVSQTLNTFQMKLAGSRAAAINFGDLPCYHVKIKRAGNLHAVPLVPLICYVDLSFLCVCGLPLISIGI
jgi:hypothetical protein